MTKNSFVKSHGLGNDYIVFDEKNIDFDLTEKNILKICDVHYGIGSDGILLKVPSKKADFGLKIFNPDGSEAEKSGNGLRIFGKFIYDYKFTKNKEFTVDTKGGIVKIKIIKEKNGKAKEITVDMGKAIFKSSEIPVKTRKKECLDEPIKIKNKIFKINCVSVGNPHCVILKEKLDEKEIKQYGSLIENFSIFPNRINVQFAKILSRKKVEILIWERGAGYTLASGSSSCAVAAVMFKKGLIDSKVTIKMPGGNLNIEIDKSWNLKMTGEVCEIASGTLSKEFFIK